LPSIVGLNILPNSVIASITLMTQHLKCFCSSLWFDRSDRFYLLTSCSHYIDNVKWKTWTWKVRCLQGRTL